jgi:hypothetical protein
MKNKLNRSNLLLIISAASAILMLTTSCTQKDPSVASELEASKTELVTKYTANFEEGWHLSKPGLPNFIDTIYGFSINEPWGRWTEGDVGIIKFSQQLPDRFSIELTGGAFGGNIGKPIKFFVGGVERKVVFAGNPFDHNKIVKLDFVNEAKSDTIVIILPFAIPVSAIDSRRLGIGLRNLKIIPEK